MLIRLTIQNYAIIDSLEIDFSSTLNVITGETGAGKSIIAGALSLILGVRADSSALVNKEKKCFVEGSFSVDGKKDIEAFLHKYELEGGHELVLRREIAINGKSRAFVNDTPVTLAQLNELSTLLVDLHQQFDTLSLGERDFQRQVMDALAGQGPAIHRYQLIFSSWQKMKKALEELRSQKLHFEKEFDYNQFQYNELHEASFSENELEELDARLKMQGNTEGVKTALTRVYHDLEESEKPMVQQLKMLQNLLSPFSQYHPGLASLLSRLQSMQIELQDIADEISMLNNQVQYDPVKIEAMQERLSTGYKLLKKHGLKTTADLLEKQQSLEEKLQAVLDIDMVIAEKEKETSRLFEEASSLAKNISTERKKQVKPFQDKVNSLLSQVGMPNAKIKVEVTEVPLHQYGGDEIEFCFDANRSNQFQPIRKVASGGELSRLMLCIKSLVAQSMDLPTLIFDEIDSGISGEAARQVGMIMKELAARRQVICITHQPQIAGRGDRHFFVFKQVVHDAVKTGIKVLSKEERITAIAKMLGGEKPTAAAMENAREMVEH